MLPKSLCKFGRPTLPTGPNMPCPGVVAVSFTECDQFAEAVRHEGLEVVQTERGRFSNQVLLIPMEETLVRYGTQVRLIMCSAEGDLPETMGNSLTAPSNPDELLIDGG